MSASLHSPGEGLQDLVFAYILRDTRGLALPTRGWRLNRYPSVAMCSLHFILEGEMRVLPVGAGLEELHPHATGTEPLAQEFACGPVTGPLHSFDLTPVCTASIIFHPAAWRALTGFPPGEMVNKCLPADEVFGAQAAAWAQDLRKAGTDAEKLAAIESCLGLLWAEKRQQHDVTISRAALLLARLSVGATAAMMQLKERTMERFFRREVGLSPREVRRMERMKTAFLTERDARAQGEAHSMAALAAEHGYTDQAHLAREFRALGGSSPSAMLKAVEEGKDESWWAYRL